jgi:outer membrane protein assembly factor BamB
MMKHKIATLTVLILINFLFVIGICPHYGIAEDFDWPRWRGPNGDGISNETDWDPDALADGPRILWKVDVGWGHSNVAIKDNRLYIIGRKGNEIGVLCINAETGEEKWHYPFERFSEPQSTPTIDGKYVYALRKIGILYCLKTKNGKLYWQKDLVKDLNSPRAAYGYAGSPIVEGDLVIVNAKTSGIALNKKTGKKIWEGDVHTDSSGDYFATPVIYDHDGKRYTLLFSDSGLFSVDVHTGKKAWFYEWTKEGSPNVVDPVVFDNKVFISSSETNSQGVLLDIKGNKPRVLWQNENMNNHISTSVYIDGYLYGIVGAYFPSTRDCTFRCIDVKTGEVMWEQEMGGASLMAADGKLIILEENGILHIAEATPSSYKKISSRIIHENEEMPPKYWTPPVLYKGKIYCRNFYGDLICIDVSK